MKRETTDILVKLVERYPRLAPYKDDILSAAELMVGAFKKGKKLLLCGNGGSAADCNHITAELLKNFRFKRNLPENLKKSLKNDEELLNGLEKGYPAISLVTNVPFMTAYMNDHDANFIFAQQVNVYGQEGDVLVAISTSGNSINCVLAAKVAKAKNLKVVSLTGVNESELSSISDVTIKVPETETYKVQELHLPIYHCLCAMIEMEME